ncbi:hypothetical protein HMPREF0591_3624 [Mycobacterium parascrofulaceum ATCC BAA-614]|uniref:Uncharacterized protein n=1 Tax=Mycobacterium parascrofulaceum ATCC BAA-614 TaxID=525368 RepID=D5PBT0_9MYCO|nr:hypothetical protein HMPREF0591_3624 [Mycobacterium parascrofulaceum ATCC BAA-614]
METTRPKIHPRSFAMYELGAWIHWSTILREMVCTRIGGFGDPITGIYIRVVRYV